MRTLIVLTVGLLSCFLLATARAEDVQTGSEADERTGLIFGISENPEDQATVQYHHTISVGPSISKDVSSGAEATSELGGDYLYRFNPKWEVGIQLDLVFERGYDAFEGYTLVPIVSYSITDRMPIFMGAGMDYDKESDQYEFVARIGTEYSFPLDADKRFSLLPGAFIDWVDGNTVIAFVLAVGYSFGSFR